MGLVEQLQRDTEDRKARVTSSHRTAEELNENPLVIEISAQDEIDGLEFLHMVEAQNRLGELKMTAGEEIEIAFPGDEPARERMVSITEITPLTSLRKWAPVFMSGLAKVMAEALRGATSHLSRGAEFLIIEGKARSVGLSRSAYAETLRSVGLELSVWNNEYRKVRDAKVVDALSGYGVIDEEAGHDYRQGADLTFKAIKECPPEHRAEILRTLVATMSRDFQALNKVVEDVRLNLRQKHTTEYKKIAVILKEYPSLSEEGLRLLLKNAAGGVKLDTDGSLLKTLNETNTMCEPILNAQESLKSGLHLAIKQAAREDPGLVAGLRRDIAAAGLDPAEFGIRKPEDHQAADRPSATVQHIERPRPEAVHDAHESRHERPAAARGGGTVVPLRPGN